MPAIENKTRRRTSQTASQPLISRNGASIPGATPVKAEPKPRPKWPSSHSKSRQQAVLQSAVEAGSDHLAVAYQAGRVNVTLSVEGVPLLDGAWQATVSVNGNSWPIAGPWELNLWHADADCDYLELTCLVAEGLRVDRQILLSRTDRFALLADAVGHVTGEQLRYSARWQMADRLLAEGTGDTPELRLLRKGRRPAARLFPVGLPQQKLTTTESSGTFTPSKVMNGSGAGIELSQTGAGTALFAPLVIDWHPERRTAPADWRALTVTEEEVIVRPDRASGYRIRIGDYQLLLYRSLQPSEDSRCLLGYHTRFETAVGQFQASGNVRQIMATIPDE